MSFDIGPNLSSILVALIAAIPAIIAARYAYKANDVSEKTRDDVNGRMGQLIEVTRAEGVTAGASEERDRARELGQLIDTSRAEGASAERDERAREAGE